METSKSKYTCICCIYKYRWRLARVNIHVYAVFRVKYT